MKSILEKARGGGGGARGRSGGIHARDPSVSDAAEKPT